MPGDVAPAAGKRHDNRTAAAPWRKDGNPAHGRLAGWQVISVEVNNQQQALAVDTDLLVKLVRSVLAGEAIASAELSVAVVDDATIHALNRRYLDHDYPTDVLSFVLDQAAGHLDGEVIVSAQTAARCCRQFGWSAAEELALYVVHVTLHLAGYDDHEPAARQAMRQKEAEYLRGCGLAARYDDGDGPGAAPPRSRQAAPGGQQGEV